MKFGLMLMFFGLFQNLLFTWYFGWHFFPQSTPEVLGDLICLLIIGVGYLIYAAAKENKPKRQATVWSKDPVLKDEIKRTPPPPTPSARIGLTPAKMKKGGVNDPPIGPRPDPPKPQPHNIKW